MYPSTTNHGNYSSTRITLQPETFSSLYDCNNDINLSLEHYHPPLSSPFQLLSPHDITFGDGTILSELLQGSVSSNDHRHQNANTVVHEQQNNLECSNNNGKVVTKYGDDDAENKTTRRRSKKDRHSKINTAQGPRDRRMRLSVEVAKKFFKLQDMLGFDKASETVEWLLMKSNSCIQELLLHQQLIQRSSKCDQVLSGNIDDQCMVKSSSSSNNKEKKKAGRGVRKSAYLLRPLARETREKARERARERTKVKSNMLGCNGGGGQYSKLRPCLDPDLNQLDTCTFNELINEQTVDDSSSSFTDNWCPSLFIYQNSSLHPHQHQSNDFQILGNLWEGNN